MITKPLDSSFLAEITRDSVLTLARQLGYEVEERDIAVDELVGWATHGEAALTGTAAVLSGVGMLLHNDMRVQIGAGAVGPNTRRLRQALIDVQRGQASDHSGWTDPVDR